MITQSKKFILERMDDKSNFTDLLYSDIDSAQEIDFTEFCNQKHCDIPKHIQHDVNSKFNYCVSSGCVCDSTLLFAIQRIEEVTYRVLSRCTYNAEIIKDPEQSKMNYRVGNIILISKQIEPLDKSKMWMNYKYRAILPVEFIYG